MERVLDFLGGVIVAIVDGPHLPVETKRQAGMCATCNGKGGLVDVHAIFLPELCPECRGTGEEKKKATGRRGKSAN